MVKPLLQRFAKDLDELGKVEQAAQTRRKKNDHADNSCTKEKIK